VSDEEHDALATTIARRWIRIRAASRDPRVVRDARSTSCCQQTTVIRLNIIVGSDGTQLAQRGGMRRLAAVSCLLVGCAGPITSSLKSHLSPRTAGIITLATGVVIGAAATAMWIEDDPGSSSGCGSSGGSDGSSSGSSGSGSSGSWTNSGWCAPSRVGAIIFAVPAVLDLFTGTRSLVTNTYPWRGDADDSTP
jgi:hypothetical protein